MKFHEWTRAAGAVTALFFIVGTLLLPALPFWLDEVLQLIGTKPGNNLGEVIAYVPQNPGGVPLGYLVQHASLVVGGVSVWSARLPSLVFAAGSVFLVAVFARQMGVDFPPLASLIFGALPIVLRYATEGRPYSQGIFFSIAGLVAGVGLARKPTPWRVAGYGAIVTAGLYSQPYTLFTAIALVIWLCWRGPRRTAILASLAVGAAVACFIPWLAYARGGWSHTIAASQFQFAFSARTPLMLLREMTGAGYFGAAILLLCAVAALRRDNGLPPENKLLLCAAILIPLAAGLVADAAFGYFVAIRQFLWVLPPLAVLASEGIVRGSPMWRVLPRCALLVSCIVAAYGYFSRPREDWHAAADRLAALTSSGSCLDVVTADQAVYYEFFRPELKDRRCGPAKRDRIVAVSPYSPANSQSRATEVPIGPESNVGGTRIKIYRSIQTAAP